MKNDIFISVKKNGLNIFIGDNFFSLETLNDARDSMLPTLSIRSSNDGMSQDFILTKNLILNKQSKKLIAEVVEFSREKITFCTGYTLTRSPESIFSKSKVDCHLNDTIRFSYSPAVLSDFFKVGGVSRLWKLFFMQEYSGFFEDFSIAVDFPYFLYTIWFCEIRQEMLS